MHLVKTRGHMGLVISFPVAKEVFHQPAEALLFSHWHSNPKKNQAGLEDRPDLLGNDFLNDYAMRLLRKIRNVLAPSGRRINAPAIIVVGSGTTGVRVAVAGPATLP